MPRLVSILIPVYNAESFVAEAIQSALDQTWPAKEVIAVDDGSTDRSAKILESFGSRIRIIGQENRGASAARNRALAEARGEFIQYLDADDLLAPDKIEIQLRRLESEPARSIASCAWSKFRDNPLECEMKPEGVWKDLLPVEWLVTSWRRGGMMPCHGWLTPREVVEKAGAWDQVPCPNDDGEFFTRVVLNSARVVFCGDARAHYRSVPDGLSRRKDLPMITAVYSSLVASTSHLLARENSDRTRNACAALFQDFAYDFYPNAAESVRLAEEMVAKYGGANVTPHLGGLIHRLLVRTIGWKLAARIRESYSSARFRLSSS